MVKNENYLIVVAFFVHSLRLKDEEKAHSFLFGLFLRLLVRQFRTFTCSQSAGLVKTRISHDVLECEQTNANGRAKPTKMQARTQLSAHTHIRTNPVQ